MAPTQRRPTNMERLYVARFNHAHGLLSTDGDYAEQCFIELLHEYRIPIHMRLKINLILAGISLDPDIAERYHDDAHEVWLLLMETRAEDEEITRYEAILEQSKQKIDERRSNALLGQGEEQQEDGAAEEEEEEEEEGEEEEEESGKEEETEEDEMLLDEHWSSSREPRLDGRIPQGEDQQHEMLDDLGDSVQRSPDGNGSLPQPDEEEDEMLMGPEVVGIGPRGYDSPAHPAEDGDEMLLDRYETLQLGATRESEDDDEMLLPLDSRDHEMLVAQTEPRDAPRLEPDDDDMLLTIDEEMRYSAQFNEADGESREPGNNIMDHDVSMEDTAETSSSRSNTVAPESESQQSRTSGRSTTDSQQTFYGEYETSATSVDEEMDADATPEPPSPPWQ